MVDHCERECTGGGERLQVSWQLHINRQQHLNHPNIEKEIWVGTRYIISPPNMSTRTKNQSSARSWKLAAKFCAINMSRNNHVTNQDLYGSARPTATQRDTTEKDTKRGIFTKCNEEPKALEGNHHVATLCGRHNYIFFWFVFSLYTIKY